VQHSLPPVSPRDKPPSCRLLFLLPEQAILRNLSQVKTPSSCPTSELPPAWLLLISLFPAPTSSCSTALHRPATLERPPCRTHSTLPHSHAAVPPQQPPRRAPRFLPRAHDAGALHPRPSLWPRRRRSVRVVSATSPAPPSDVGTSNIHRTDTCSQTRRRRAFPRSSSAWPPTD
jgi:hypothetical protein